VKPFERATPWEILGVEPGATVAEVRCAYERLSALLTPGSLALYSAAELDEQNVLYQHLRTAYLTLLPVCEEVEGLGAAAAQDVLVSTVDEAAAAPPSPPTDRHPAVDPNVELTGEGLKHVREMRRITLADLSQRTRIRTQMLEALEAEAFEKLPERVFVRGFVMSVARELGVDPVRAWATYGGRWENWAKARR